MNRVTRTLGKKVGFGRFGLPIWAVGAAVAIVGAAAGQAVGPVLTGSTTGTINLVVAQAITLDRDMFDLGENPSATGDDSVATRNDEGTNFTVAIELHQGERRYVCLALKNYSGRDGSAILELNVPSGIDVEVEEFSASSDMTATTQDCDGAAGDGSMDGLGISTFVNETQMSKSSWLLVVDADAGQTGAGGEGVQITLEPKDDLAPGFYTIGGRIHQTAG